MFTPMLLFVKLSSDGQIHSFHFHPNKCFNFFWYSLFWNWVNMSWISITSRSFFTCCQLFQTLIFFYASSICLEAFVFIVWLGISSASCICQLFEPCSGLFCCPIFLKYIITLQQSTFARLVSIRVYLLFCIHLFTHFYIKI